MGPRAQTAFTSLRSVKELRAGPHTGHPYMYLHYFSKGTMPGAGPLE